MEIQLQQQHAKQENGSSNSRRSPGSSRPVSGAESRDAWDKQFIKLNYRMDRLYKDVNRQFQDLRSFMGAPTNKGRDGDGAKSGDESGYASGNASPGVPTNGFSVITRQDSDVESLVFEEKSGKVVKKPSIGIVPEKDLSSTPSGILRRKSLTTESPSTKKRPSFSEPVVSKVAVFNSNDNDSSSPDVTMSPVKAALVADKEHRSRARSRSASLDTDDENSDDSGDSRCTVVEEDSSEEDKESQVQTSSRESSSGVDSTNAMDNTMQLEVTNVSESDVIKDFEVKLKPCTVVPVVDSKISPRKEKEKGKNKILPFVNEQIIGPSLSQITGGNLRPVNRGVRIPATNATVISGDSTKDSFSGSSVNSSFSGSKAQRVALEQALKNTGMLSTNVSPVINPDNSTLADDETIGTLHDDDRSIVTVDSKSVPPGPTVDMVYKIMHRGIVSER